MRVDAIRDALRRQFVAARAMATARRCSAAARVRAIIVLGAVIGSIVMISSGNLYMLNAYSQAMKEQRHFSQTQLDLVASLSNFGVCFSPPSGYAIDYAGVVPTMVIGTVLSTGGYLLAWAGTVGYFTMTGIVLAVFYLIMSLGMSFTYLAALIVNMRNISEKYRGAIVALMETIYALGAAIFTAIYSSRFGGAVLPPLQQNLTGFLLFVSLFSLAVGVIGTVGMRYAPHAKAEHAAYMAEKREERRVARERRRRRKLGTAADAAAPSDESSALIASTAAATKVATDAAGRPAVGGIAVLRKPNFWLMFVLYVIGTSVCLMYNYNVAFVLAAGGQDAYVDAHAILLPIAGALGRMLGGVVSDAALRRHAVPRATFLIVASALAALSCPIVAFCVASPPAMFFTTSAIGIATGLYWVLGSVLMSEEFGITTAGQNWSYLLLSSALGGILFNWFASTLYDRHSDAAGQCVGTVCFQTTFLICLGVMAFAIAVSALLFRRLVVPLWALDRQRERRAAAAAARGDLAPGPSATVQADDSSP